MSMPKNIKLRPKAERLYSKSYDLKKSRTKQEFAKQCDVNRLVSSYMKTGQFDNPHGLGMFEDVSEVPDYQNALQLVINARQSFEELDPNLRKKFHNSPQELLAFLSDPSNEEESIKLGLRKEKPKPEPIPLVQIHNPLTEEKKSDSKSE